MKKIFTVFVVLGLLLVALVACSPISRGTIVDKKYHEAYEYPVQYCAMYDPKDLTKCAMYGTRYEQVSEKWSFDLVQGEREGWAYVSKAIWDRYEIGDYFDQEREQ